MDRPLPASCAAGKGGVDDGGTNGGSQSRITHQIGMVLPSPTQGGTTSGNKEGNYDGNEGGSDDNSNGDGGKSDGNGNEGAGRATTRAMAVMRTVAAMRVKSDKEGEGGKAMETVTRLAGEQWQQQ